MGCRARDLSTASQSPQAGGALGQEVSLKTIPLPNGSACCPIGSFQASSPELAMFAARLPPAHRCVFCACATSAAEPLPRPGSTVRSYATTRSLHPRHCALIADAMSARSVTTRGAKPGIGSCGSVGELIRTPAVVVPASGGAGLAPRAGCAGAMTARSRPRPEAPQGLLHQGFRHLPPMRRKAVSPGL
jgi:hypothetical protein